MTRDTSLTKILLILQSIILLLMCLRLLTKPLCLKNTENLTSIIGFQNLTYYIMKKINFLRKIQNLNIIIVITIIIACLYYNNNKNNNRNFDSVAQHSYISMTQMLTYCYCICGFF